VDGGGFVRGCVGEGRRKRRREESPSHEDGTTKGEPAVRGGGGTDRDRRRGGRGFGRSERRIGGTVRRAASHRATGNQGTRTRTRFERMHCVCRRRRMDNDGERGDSSGGRQQGGDLHWRHGGQHKHGVMERFHR
jgi:hypothetical protein